ncbi:retropepsin-like aspartic protease [Aquimarina algicola]|uniref:Acid protease n=1 Tax=Aquimarina algicola TaxID=2589995 RepID=A0A504J899_9FLAO|nr:retropepsin-like aspartic protease [Aquimarina algicola]TPN86804.1 acid protease [Aquimarina algicola]
MRRTLKMLTVLTLTATITSCAQSNNINENKTTVLEFNLEKSLLANGYIKVPMTKEISGHLQLKGSINGVKGIFILDTGAGATVIERTQKEKFKMKAINTDNVATGAGGSGIAMQDSKNNELILSSLKMENKSLTLMDLGYVNNAFETLGIKKIDGVIGADVLTKGDAIIDYVNLILYLKR